MDRIQVIVELPSEFRPLQRSFDSSARAQAVLNPDAGPAAFRMAAP
jgi:hypothetical protein